ncbi:MAG: T9SS type A sorting domain-containing protein [Bacteroidales bacterium]|nr:T9SS type A sorting domain-containing protein [Bacteroidales bacterium]
MKKYLLSALFTVALLLPWAPKAQCDLLKDYTPSATSGTFASINTFGTSWTLAERADGIAKFVMPFDMAFGSQLISSGDTVYVSKNGFLSFSPITSPATMPTTMVVAPMAYLSGSGYRETSLGIFYTTSADSVVVEWRFAQVDDITLNFQVIFQKKDNTVQFAFGDMTLSATRYSFTQGLMVNASEIIGCTDSISWPAFTPDTLLTPRTLTSYNPSPANNVYTFTLPNRRPCSPVATNIKANTATLNWSNVRPYDANYHYTVFYTTDSALLDTIVARHDKANYTLLPAGTQIDTNYLDVTGLAANTKYYFAVYSNTTTPMDNGYLSDVAFFTTAMDTIDADTINACVQYKINESVLKDDGTYDTNVLITATDSSLRVVNRGGKDSILRQVYIIHEPTFMTVQYVACDSAYWNIWYATDSASATVSPDATADTSFRYVVSNQQAYIVPDTTPMLGCDIRMLDLTINYSSHDTIEDVACDTYKWFIGGDSAFTLVDGTPVDSIRHTIDATPNYDSTFWDINVVQGLTADGCPKVHDLKLRLFGNGSSTDTVRACGSYRWINDSLHTVSTTTDTFQLTGSNGCLHTVTLNLTLNYSTDSVLAPVTACDSYIWKVDTIRWEVSPTTVRRVTVDTFYTSDTVAYKFHNAVGCDSTVHLPLTINYKSFATVDTNVCDQFKWVGVDNRIYRNDTIIPDSLNKKLAGGNVAGCDSIISLNLTVRHKSVTDSIFDTACAEYAWHITGVWHDTDDVDTTFTYTLANNAAAANKTRTFHLDNAVGCDSTLMLFLYIKSHQTSTAVDTTIASCASEYVYNGKRYAAPNATANGGNYATYTIPTFIGVAPNGCDSLHNITLFVGNPYYKTFNKTACGEYTWMESGIGDGKTYAQRESGDPDNVIYRNVTDDSYVYTNTIPTTTVYDTNNNLTTTTPYTFVPDTVYSLHLNFQTAAFGYDTVSHLMTTTNLLLGDSTISMLPYRTARHDTVFTKSVRFGIRDLYCDSIVRYNLNLVYNYTEVPVTLCMRDADSVITWAAGDTTLSFTVPANPNTMRDTVYSGQVVVRDSATANEWGYILLIDQLRNAYSTFTVTACGTYTWSSSIGGNDSTHVYSATASYPKNPADFVRFDAENGCDSIVVLNLTLNPLTETAVQQCKNFYKWSVTGDTTYANFSSSNRYVETIEVATIDTATGACLSAQRLYLTLVKPDTTVVRQCTGTYTWDRNNYVYQRNAAGTLQYSTDGGTTWAGTAVASKRTRTYNSAGRCDSLYFLDLVISDGNPTYGTMSANECDEYTWVVDVPNDYTMATSTPVTVGTYTNDTVVGYMFNNARTGCDSILTLVLTVSNAAMGVQNVIACDAYTWIDGLYYTESTNTPRFRIPRASGCDSIVNLNLVINYSQTENIFDTICAGNGYNAHNFVIPSSSLPAQGTYRDSRIFPGLATNGCDMISVLTLRINPVSSSVEEIKACQNYTWNGMTYVTDGSYSVHGLNQYGCDSTATIILSLGEPSTSTEEYAACEQITYQGETYYNTTILVNNYTTEYGCVNTDTIRLIVNQPSHSEMWVTEYGSFYDWFNGNTYTSTGTYYDTLHAADVNGCDSIITLYLTIITNGIEGSDVESQMSLYPNPTYGMVTISGADVQRVEVLDIVGRKVAEFTNTNVLDLTNLAEGAYTLRITTDKATVIRKVVKK